MGDIDIGGLKRFGPQSSAQPAARAERVQPAERPGAHARGRHLLKAGALAEHYQDNMVNPTFSLGIFTFADLNAFLTNRPATFVGLTPEAQFDRYWRFTLFGFYVQDDFQVTPRLTVNGGLRYEFSTMPAEKYGRDSALPDLSAAQPTIGPLYENPTYTNVSPRGGFAWDVFGDGRTAVRGGYGLYFNTNSHQNLIVTVTNPPFTPRPVIVNPTFPNPPFDRAERDLDPADAVRHRDAARPRLQRQRAARALVEDGGDGSATRDRAARTCWRSNDVNTAQPTGTTADGTPFIPAGTPRHQHGVLDDRAEEQRRRLLVQRADLRRAAALERRVLGAVVVHVLEERRHHAGLDVLLRRDQRHDVRVARVHARLQQGAVGLRHAAQLGPERHVGAAVREGARPARPARCSTAGTCRGSGRCAAATR